MHLCIVFVYCLITFVKQKTSGMVLVNSSPLQISQDLLHLLLITTMKNQTTEFFKVLNFLNMKNWLAIFSFLLSASITAQKYWRV
jgi:hydrogenase-4 membrane subunit HyfE